MGLPLGEPMRRLLFYLQLAAHLLRRSLPIVPAEGHHLLGLGRAGPVELQHVVVAGVLIGRLVSDVVVQAEPLFRRRRVAAVQVLS